MTGVTRYQLERTKKSRPTIIFIIFTGDYWDCLKKNLNASKRSEHPRKAFRWEHRLANKVKPLQHGISSYSPMVVA